MHHGVIFQRVDLHNLIEDYLIALSRVVQAQVDSIGAIVYVHLQPFVALVVGHSER